MTVETLGPIIWADYRLALIFLVFLPLLLLLWAFVSRVEAIQRLLIIYWKVSSLLVVTILLMIAALPISFLAGWLARILVPICLWFWIDLNEDIADMQPWRPLKVTFNAWRWAVTIYSGAGAVFGIFFLRCALSTKSSLLLEESLCRLWLEPAWGFREYFLMGYTPAFLGFFGILGLLVYVVILGYFVMVNLGRQGRSATGQ